MALAIGDDVFAAAEASTQSSIPCWMAYIRVPAGDTELVSFAGNSLSYCRFGSTGRAMALAACVQRQDFGALAGAVSAPLELVTSLCRVASVVLCIRTFRW